LVCGFQSTIHPIATGFAGGGIFNGNAHREVITIPFSYNCKKIKYHLESGIYEALKHGKVSAC
jgi:hypothetical protein